MKIALLSPLPPQQSGIADYAGHWRDALSSLGVEVVTPLKDQSLRNDDEARSWAADVDWRDVDVVHAELGGGHLSEFYALRALQALRPTLLSAPLSATVHDPERLVWRPVTSLGRALEGAGVPPTLRKAATLVMDPLSLAAERRLARGMDGLVTLTRTGARCLGERMRLPPDRVVVIPHGTLHITERELPEPWPLKLLYFGFIYAGKGIEDLIDALARLRDLVPERAHDVRLSIAGGSAPQIAFGAKTSYLDMLRQRVAQHGLQEQVDWHLDVREERIAELMQSHHVVVLPYHESAKLRWLGQMRGTSGVLAWALACGRGVITSDARAFAEEISQGNGRAYPQGDVAELAQCLAQAVRQPQSITEWARAAQRVGSQRSWSSTARDFVRYFEGLVQAHVTCAVPLRRPSPLQGLSGGPP